MKHTWINTAHLKKMLQTWKNASNLKKCGSLGKTQQAWKNANKGAAHLQKYGKLRKMRHTWKKMHTTGGPSSESEELFFFDICANVQYAKRDIFTTDIYLSNRPLFLWVYWRNKPRGVWENTRKACKSRAVRQVIYKVSECSPNIPSG